VALLAGRSAGGVLAGRSRRCCSLPCATPSVALAEAADALGYIVGKRAAAPDGAAVTIELTG
jgi:hypothetical protein